MAFANGYTYRRTITIDESKVSGSSDFTDFTILVSGTYAYLKTTANGGNVTNSSGYDIKFETTGGTTLDYERERYIATTGEVIFWVQIPTLSYNTNTDIYMYYNNSSVSTDQSNKTGTWESSYVCVYHLPDGSTLSGADSTSNGITLTATGPTALSGGKVGGGAQQSSPASYNGLWSGTIGSNLQLYSGSFGGWIKTSSPGASYRGIFGVQGAYGMFLVSNVFGMYSWGNGAFRSTGTSLNDGNWHQVYAVFDHNVSNGSKLYIDGALSLTTTITVQSFSANLTAFIVASAGQELTGHLDELRVENVKRSDDFVATQYNTQNSPATFYSVGSEQTSGGGGSSNASARMLMGMGS